MRIVFDRELSVNIIRAAIRITMGPPLSPATVQLLLLRQFARWVMEGLVDNTHATAPQLADDFKLAQAPHRLCLTIAGYAMMWTI